jgi:hypothetical protein
MSSSAVSRGGETPGWLLRFFDWYGAQKRMGDQMDGTVDARIQELQERFDGIGWGLLFLLFAALALPNGNAEYASAAVVGGLMLMLNGVRIAMGVPVRWLSVVLGTVMLVAGSSALVGVKMDVFVLFFALAGLVTIAGAFVRREAPRAA